MQEFFDPSLNVAHFAFGDVGSTNDEAFKLAEEKGLPVCFVTAKRQLRGRGRRGRPWISELGNLYVSAFLRAPAEPEQCAGLSFVAAVSLRDALESLIGEKDCCACLLKWPNDVLWNGAKIAGLLLEARGDGQAMNVVVGMGVNCAHSPSDTPYPATNLAKEGVSVVPDVLFEALKSSFLANVILWDQGRGFPTIRKKWLTHARGLGQELVVRLDDEEIQGQFRDLDEDGRLILGRSQEPDRIITSGDVFFR